MDELSVVGMVAIICEMTWRMSVCDKMYITIFEPYSVFISTYLLCILVALFDLKHIKFFQSTRIRQILSFLHAIDPITAATLGIGLYFKRIDITFLSVVASTKIGLLSFVTRMITGKACKTKMDSVLETTRAYLHHVGSFLFLNSNELALITAIWRCLTLLGHALVASKIKSDNPTLTANYESRIRFIAYLRQFLLFSVLLTCFLIPHIRREFGKLFYTYLHYLP